MLRSQEVTADVRGSLHLALGDQYKEKGLSKPLVGIYHTAKALLSRVSRRERGGTFVFSSTEPFRLIRSAEMAHQGFCHVCPL